MEILLARQPVFDRAERVVAYDLLLRGSTLAFTQLVTVSVANAGEPELAAIAARTQQGSATLLALHARHRGQRAVCEQLGFELFEGFHFAAPETLARRDLPLEHLQTFR